MPEIKSETTRDQREKIFESDKKLRNGLDGTTNKIRKTYYTLLNIERNNLFDPNNPGPVTVSVEKRLELLEKAKSGDDITSIIENAKNEKLFEQDQTRPPPNKVVTTPYPSTSRSGRSFWGNANAGLSEPSERDD